MGKMEPMVEIFLGEANTIISEMKDHVEDGREKGAFGHDQIEDIFRYIHTIKADAAMMLYENIAEPARELEKILYIYRNEKGQVADLEGFLELMDEIVDFFEGEIKKLIDGVRMDGDCTILVEHIHSYLAKLKGEEEQEKQKQEKKEEEEEEEEQFFYISSDSTNVVKPAENEKKSTLEKTENADNHKKPIVIGQEHKEEQKEIGTENNLFVPEMTVPKRPKHILISSQEMDNLDSINLRFLKLAGNNMNSEAQSLARELDNWLWRVHSTDFTLVAAKLDMTIKNMLRNLDKQVEFHATGSEITIEKEKIDKISDAMIHLVRNAVDHGIETPEERRKCNKPETGKVTVDIEWLKNHSGVRIYIADDGKGLNKNELLDKAEQKGILKKPKEEYSEKETFELIFEPGFTTRETAGEYSGLGVGMDVVRHSMEEIGGSVQIESTYGAGTKFIMEIAYEISGKTDNSQENRRALIDESINSRR